MTPVATWGQLDCGRAAAETALRRTSDQHATMRNGREAWVGDFSGDIDPRERELGDRPVGIIGFGRIGRRLRELLVPFGCPILVHDPFLPADAARAAGVEAVPLPVLLRDADVVVLCAANTGSTAKLIGAAEIAVLRRDAVFIHVARSALVDHEALVARLQLPGLDG